MKRWEREGVIEITELTLPDNEQLAKGVAVIECIQEIPCNPCVDVCPVHAITMHDINALPHVDYSACVGCGKCIEVCPGLAIFLIKITGDKAFVTIPYEFIPLPEIGDVVHAFNREGKHICDGEVKRIKKDITPVITVAIPKEYAMDVRHIGVNP